MISPVLAIDAKATEHVLHRQGIGRLKHTDVAYLWIPDEVRSRILRARRVKSEKNVADLGTKLLSNAVISKHSITLVYPNMAEDKVKDAQQDLAIFWDFGSGRGVRDELQDAQLSEHSK